MPIVPACLTAACPWCGQPNIAPVGTPLPELEALLESRCGACSGGMRARASWHAFASFVMGFGLLSDVTLLLALDGRLTVGAPLSAALTGAYAVAFLAVTLALAAYLRANSTVRRGRPPAGREDGW